MKLLHEEITEKIIKSFYKVYNTLGYGFLEKVYENALAIELRKNGLEAKCQHPISVLYENEIVGEYFADTIVNNTVVLELKASKELTEENECQLLNYLVSERKLLTNYHSDK